MSGSSNPLTNGTYWGPDEPPADILFERLFLASGYLTGVMFGMQFILFINCIQVLRSEKKRRYTNFLIIYSTLLTVTNLIYTITSYLGIQLTFIDDRNFPGGPVAVLGVEAPLASNVISITMLVAGNVLSDALLLWRCRVIWAASIGSKANYVLLLPVCILLASLGMGLMFDIEIASPVVGLYGLQTVHAATAYFSLSLVLNVILTLLIAYRIRSYQSLIQNSLGKGYGKQYTSITTMFVESAALYSVVSIGLLVTFALNSSSNQIFIGFGPGTQIIATYLIILRVASGKAWSADTFTKSGGTTSTLVFAPPSQKRSKNNTGATSSFFKTTSQSQSHISTGMQDDLGLPLHELKSTSSGQTRAVRSDAWREDADGRC